MEDKICTRNSTHDSRWYTPKRQPSGLHTLLGLSLLVMGLLLGPTLSWAVSSRQMLKFKANTSVTVQDQIIAKSGSTLLQRLPLVNAVAIRLPAGDETTALETLRNRKEVLVIEEDAPLTVPAEQDAMGGAQATLVTDTAPLSDPNGYHWNLRQIYLDQARKNFKGHGIRIAVVDTGIDASHPLFAGVVTQGYNARAGEDPNKWNDDNGHGTHVAGLVAATLERSYFRSIAPKATLYAVKVLDETGNGYLSDLINGLTWISSHPNSRKVNIVNLSLGFTQDSLLLHEAIQILYNRGIILVAAVGNYDTTTASGEGAAGEGAAGEGAASDTDCTTQGVKYPAKYLETIGVGATDAYGAIAPYSIGGPEVDVVAPGGTRDNPIFSLNLAQGYGLANGTSQATAHVTGLVALLLSVKSDLTPAEVMTILQTTAIDLGVAGEWQGAGLVDAELAIDLAMRW